MRHPKPVLAPWVVAVALLTCALVTTQPITANPRLQVNIMPVKKRLRINGRQHIRAAVRWNGPPAKLSYQWSALRGELPAGTITNRKTLLLDASKLTPGEEYQLELDVTASYKLPPVKGERRDSSEAAPSAEDEVAAQASVVFAVNAPPSSGNCKAAVEWQPNNRARISVSAPDWLDEDGDALQYRFFLVKNKTRRLVQGWTRDSDKTITTRAAAGQSLRIECEVRDTLGDAARASSASSTRP